MSKNPELSLRLQRRRKAKHKSLSKQAGHAMRQIVRLCNMSQREFGNESGQNQSKVSQVVNGNFQPEIMTLERFLSTGARVLGHDISFVMRVTPKGDVSIKTELHD